VLAVAAHWFRFKVPLSVAVGVAGAATLGVTGVGALLRLAGLEAYPVSQLILVAGILVFLLAMYWDKSDPRRVTGRADVAFWLHILAAPMMIHPVVTLFKLLELGSGTREALTVVALYAGISVVSLAIDRRALMVSALVYVLVALNVLLEKAGVVDLAFAATAFVLGSALLLLSIYWHAVRSFVLRCLPPKLRASLPPLQ
ncbi:MAG: hypothetical protein KKC79_09135, partial [Gammaproteobacteria bacterium]|nr:hypothetical protein [Gammaproteobacteria bacterium]